MNCQNCGVENNQNSKFCSECGVAINETSRTNSVVGPQKRSLIMRIIMTLYALAYLFLILVSFSVYYSENLSVIDYQASYITCEDGSKLTYQQLGINSPSSAYRLNTENNVIALACGNNGGNTYTDNYKKSGNNPFGDALIIFGIGMVIIEVSKAVLVFITHGYVPEIGSFSRKVQKSDQ